MPAAVPIALSVMAASAIYQGVQSNQEKQHAIGAAEAEQTAMQAQIDKQTKMDEELKKQQSDQAAASAAQNANQAQSTAEARKRAMGAGSSTLESTILTSPLGAAPAMTQGKTLLGA